MIAFLRITFLLCLLPIYALADTNLKPRATSPIKNKITLTVAIEEINDTLYYDCKP